MRRLRDVPFVRVYLFGQALSILGDSALWLALGIWVRVLTGSNGLAGLTFVFLVGPALLGPVLGTVVDRFPRRPVLIALNASGGALSLALLGVQDRGQVWLIWLVMIGFGVLNATIGAAQNGLLHSLLPEDLLGDASGLLATVREGLRLVAPLIGAGLFSLAGGHVVALLDALTFAVATVTVFRTRVVEPAPAPRPASLRLEIGAGWTHIRRTVGLRQIVLALSVAVCVVGFGETTGFAVVTTGLHRPATWIGVLQSATGVGAIAGGVTVARAMRRWGEGRVCAIGLLLFAIGAAGYLLPTLSGVLVTRPISGFGLPWLIAAAMTAVQRLTPGGLQGRVTATTELLTGCPQAISIAVGAGLVGSVGFRPLVTAEVVVTAAAGGWLLTRRAQRPSTTEADVEVLLRDSAPPLVSTG